MGQRCGSCGRNTEFLDRGRVGFCRGCLREFCAAHRPHGPELYGSPDDRRLLIRLLHEAGVWPRYQNERRCRQCWHRIAANLQAGLAPERRRPAPPERPEDELED